MSGGGAPIRLDRVSKRFGRFTVLDDAPLDALVRLIFFVFPETAE